MSLAFRVHAACKGSPSWYHHKRHSSCWSLSSARSGHMYCVAARSMMGRDEWSRWGHWARTYP